jgi:ABC-2 type transport system ATP-binding protein
MVPALRIAGVAKRFGATQALAGIDLEVAQGEFFELCASSCANW